MRSWGSGRCRLSEPSVRHRLVGSINQTTKPKYSVQTSPPQDLSSSHNHPTFLFSKPSRMPFLRTSTQLYRSLSALKTSRQFPISASHIRTMASSAMSKRLEGKTILITGASSGIGRSTAIEFARTSPKNLRLILTARRIDTLKEVAADIQKDVGDGVKVLPFQLDVSSPDEVRSFVGKLPEEWREIDVLVNNA